MNTTATPAEAIAAAEAQGTIEIAPGVYLHTREALQAEQEGWPDEDLAKNDDFSGYPYWITDDAGMDPMGITGEDDADLVEALANA